MNKREMGTKGEERAARYLESRGMRIAARNFRNRRGEIDLVGYHEGYLVFVEVKYRRTDRKGSATEAVNLPKQRQICKVADYYRYVHGLGEMTPVRYDVVALQGEEILWLKNAFPHRYV